MDCGPTLDIGDLSDEEDGAEGIDGETESQMLWGRLFPLGKGLTGIGKSVHKLIHSNTRSLVLV